MKQNPSLYFKKICVICGLFLSAQIRVKQKTINKKIALARGDSGKRLMDVYRVCYGG